MAFWETVLGKHIMTMAIAAVPVVELRGAIPAGIAAGLDPWLACGAAIFGNLLPVPFIILLVRQVFDRLRKHAFFAPKIDALERRAHLKGRLVRKYRLLGLMLFVAIPLPGTGAWTGSWASGAAVSDSGFGCSSAWAFLASCSAFSAALRSFLLINS